MKFRTILADPPWDYKMWGKMGRHRSPEKHYPVLSLDDIATLPVSLVAADNCVLLLWTTWPLLAEGSMQAILSGWGFEGKTGFPWLKLSRDMIPRMGTGYHARACTEPLLIATRGKPPCPEPWERLEGVLFSKLGEHSAKPDTIYSRAELYDGPYLEMFSRPDGGLEIPRPNWTRIGNEMDGLDIGESLKRLAAREVIPSIVPTAIYTNTQQQGKPPYSQAGLPYRESVSQSCNRSHLIQGRTETQCKQVLFAESTDVPGENIE